MNTQKRVAVIAVFLAGLGTLLWLGPDSDSAAILIQRQSGDVGPALDSGLDQRSAPAILEEQVVETRVSVPNAGDEALESPFFARILEVDTGIPVPRYWVRVRDVRRMEELVESTDEGMIRTEKAWEAGPLTVHALDHPSLETHNAFVRQVSLHSHLPVEGGSPVDIKVRVGPTYYLDTVLPEGLGHDEFHLLLRPTVSAIVVMPAWAPMRAGPLPWVRFASVTPDLPGGGPWNLEARSDDGLWFGETLVESDEGIYPIPVPLRIDSRGRLEVRLTSGGATLIDPVQGGERLEIQGPTETVSHLGRGPFTIENLRPGPYLLKYVDSLHEAVQADVIVQPGVTTKTVLALHRRGDLLPLAGVLQSSAGPIDFGDVTVVIGSKSMSMPLKYRIREVGSRIEVGFRFDEVPPGEYTLKLRREGGVQAVPEERSVRAGDEGIVVSCTASPSARVWYDLVVHDATTDKLIPYPSMSLREENTWTMTVGESGGHLFAHSAPDTRTEWMVWAEGYAPWRSAPEKHDASTPVIVLLSLGWGADFYFTDEAKEPVESVGLLLDGEFVGESDARGRLRVNRAVPPKRIWIQSERWELGPGSAIKADGTYRDMPAGIEIRLSPLE